MQTLNDWVMRAWLFTAKISHQAYFSVMKDYMALRAGELVGVTSGA